MLQGPGRVPSGSVRVFVAQDLDVVQYVFNDPCLIAPIVGADAKLRVNEHKTVAVDDSFGPFGLSVAGMRPFWRRIHHRQLKAVSDQGLNVVQFTGQKNPALGICAISVGIAAEPRRRVPFWINAEGDQANQGLGGLFKPGLQLRHPGRQQRAYAGAAGKHKICHPHMAGQRLAAKRLTALGQQTKVRDGLVDW